MLSIFNFLLINYRLFQGLVNNEYLNLLLDFNFPPLTFIFLINHYFMAIFPLF